MDSTNGTTPCFEQPLSIDEVAAIIASDVRVMSEAQIAGILTEIHLSSQTMIGEVVAPLARAELARRRELGIVEAGWTITSA